MYLSDFEYLHPFRGYLRSKSSRAKWGQILHVFALPHFFLGGGGQASKFLDLDYKIEHISRHVAKFHGDRPTELGDLVHGENN